MGKGRGMTVILAEFPSTVAEGERVQLVRERRAYRSRRLNRKGEPLPGSIIALEPDQAWAFHEAASKAGTVYAPPQTPDTGIPDPLPREGTVRRALLDLLLMYPNEVVRSSEVRARLGRDVSRNAVSDAAKWLRVTMPVVAHYGAGGGYMLARRVTATGDARCLNCRSKVGILPVSCAFMGGPIDLPGRMTCGAYRGAV